MNAWLWAALGMLAAIPPCVAGCIRGELDARLAALELASAIVALELVLLAEGFRQPFFYDLPVLLALLSFGGGMVFARFVERWL